MHGRDSRRLLLTDLESTWAAGFFDGEGTTVVRRWKNKNGTERRYMGLAVRQVRREPLERFLAAVGVGSITGPYANAARRSKPTFAWQAGSRDDVERVIALLYPLLSLPKREQIDAARKKLRGLTTREAADVLDTSYVTVHRRAEAARLTVQKEIA